jgi:hypothetical protein
MTRLQVSGNDNRHGIDLNFIPSQGEGLQPIVKTYFI